MFDGYAFTDPNIDVCNLIEGRKDSLKKEVFETVKLDARKNLAFQDEDIAELAEIVEHKRKLAESMASAAV